MRQVIRKANRVEVTIFFGMLNEINGGITGAAYCTLWDNLEKKLKAENLSIDNNGMLIGDKGGN